MKKTNVLLLLTIVLCCTGCEEKKTEDKPLFVENTTEVFTQKDRQLQQEKQNMPTNKISSVQATSFENKDARKNTYTLKNINNTIQKLSLTHKTISFENIDQPVILLTVFSSLSHPYLMQTAAFEKLQKKYSSKVFIASISSKAINDENSKQLKNTNYFISSNTENEKIISHFYEAFNIEEDDTQPLTIIYKNKTYYSHFEGAVPIEMLNHEIQQAIQN